MRRSEALALLGLTTVQAREPTSLRAAYRQRIRAAHPDLNADADATERTARLTAAYRLLSRDADRWSATHGAEPPAPTDASPGAPRNDSARRARTRRPQAPRVRASVLDATTVRVEGSREEVFAAVLEASHRLGEVGYLDSTAALVEVIVEFVEAPTSSLVMSLQGRAGGFVDVFCAVEPLSGGESPPVEAVTRLLADTLGGIEVADLAV